MEKKEKNKDFEPDLECQEDLRIELIICGDGLANNLKFQVR